MAAAALASRAALDASLSARTPPLESATAAHAAVALAPLAALSVSLSDRTLRFAMAVAAHAAAALALLAALHAFRSARPSPLQKRRPVAKAFVPELDDAVHTHECMDCWLLGQYSDGPDSFGKCPPGFLYDLAFLFVAVVGVWPRTGHF